MKIILKRFLVASLVLTLFLSFGTTAVQAAVQSITAGKGIDVEGTKDVTISVDKQFRLPQNCTSGQVAAWNGNRWSCVYNGLTLPFVTTGTWDTDVFSLTNLGTGAVGRFFLNNTTTSMPALWSQTQGTGNALSAHSEGSGNAIGAYMRGTGHAGQFRINNPANTNSALEVYTNGNGQAIDAYTTGDGSAISAGTSGNGFAALTASNEGTGMAGVFAIENPDNENSALQVKAGHKGTAFQSYMWGTGKSGLFSIDNPANSSDAVYITTNGSGSAIQATTEGAGWIANLNTNSGRGLLISVPSGNEGLNVASGTKNAVVATTNGARLLYTEESTQVWFTDYGFGKLKNGIAAVTIDPLFAQTVNLNEPYHVFVQAYGDSNLYVTNRTRTGFEVRGRESNSDVEFSYRLVAKRLGYEGKRLEHAEWADTDVNLYPAK